jgi:DNA polymerase-3 subunit beta
VSGNVVFTSKLIDATYPDMDQIIPKPADAYISMQRADFVGAFKRLSGLEAENSTINIRWKADEGSIEMALTGNGSGVESVSCECGIRDGEIAFQPNILGGMLDVVKGDVIQLHITDPNGPMVIVDPDDPGLTVIAMPCKGKG